MVWVAVIFALLPVGVTVEQRFQPFDSRAACEAVAAEITSQLQAAGVHVIGARCVSRREGEA